MASSRLPQSDEPPPKYERFMFSSSGQLADNNEKLVSDLDNLETLVEKLRISAYELEDKKEALTRTLTKIVEQSNGTHLAAGHKEEIQTNINRLMMRLLSVDVKVTVPRTSEQEDAYRNAKAMLNELHRKVTQGLVDSKNLLESYLNACSSESQGAVDHKFQSVILSCTIDDQKQVRKCLSRWSSTCNALKEDWTNECRLSDMKL